MATKNLKQRVPSKNTSFWISKHFPDRKTLLSYTWQKQKPKNYIIYLQNNVYFYVYKNNFYYLKISTKHFRFLARSSFYIGIFKLTLEITEKWFFYEIIIIAFVVILNVQNLLKEWGHQWRHACPNLWFYKKLQDASSALCTRLLPSYNYNIIYIWKILQC